MQAHPHPPSCCCSPVRQFEVCSLQESTHSMAGPAHIQPDRLQTLKRFERQAKEQLANAGHDAVQMQRGKGRSDNMNGLPQRV